MCRHPCCRLTWAGWCRAPSTAPRLPPPTARRLPRTSLAWRRRRPARATRPPGKLQLRGAGLHPTAADGFSSTVDARSLRTTPPQRSACAWPPLCRRFHRIIPTFMCQGGDFTADNGAGCAGRANLGGCLLRCIGCHPKTRGGTTTGIGSRIEKPRALLSSFCRHGRLLHLRRALPR